MHDGGRPDAGTAPVLSGADAAPPTYGGDDASAATIRDPDAGDAGPGLADAPALDAAASGYPAFAPDLGQIVNHGESVLRAPRVVAITWDVDPSQATFERFADGLGATAYWSATTSEYGVGPASSGPANHVHVSGAAPATMQDADLKKLVTQNAGGAWPAPTPDSIYAFFLPPATSLQIQGADACSQGIGGYHDQVTAGSTLIAYAVVPSCSLRRGMTIAQQATAAMSHELSEASTDPWPHETRPGYVGFDAAHFSFDWFQSFQSENGDACELYKSSFFQDTEQSFPFWVQRTWSNASARAGHDPCVPAPAAPYFNVTPLNLTTVDVDTSSLAQGGGGNAMAPTKGVHIAQGQSAAIELGYFSDAPTSGPWTLDSIEGSPLSPLRSPRLTVSIDKTTGVNGDRATAKVTVNVVGPLKAELIVFRSTLGADKHYMPVVIGSE